MASAALKGALGLIVALLFAIGIGAFAGVGPLAGVTPASSVTDPREMVARSLQAVMDADAVHLDVSVSGSLPGAVAGRGDVPLDLEGTAGDADVRPKEVRSRLHIQVPAAGLDLDTVSSWDSLWHRTAPDGAWSRGSVAEIVSAFGLDANPLTLVDSLRAALARLPEPDLEDIPCGSDSGACRLLTVEAGTVAGDAIRRSVAEATGVVLPPLYVIASLQSDVETLRPYQLDIDVLSEDGTADLRMVVDFSGWNEAVPIEEPVTGWWRGSGPRMAG
jgi:hypothetical protein